MELIDYKNETIGYTSTKGFEMENQTRPRSIKNDSGLNKKGGPNSSFIST